MTIHAESKEITCLKCSAIFIPFRENLPCPNCGEPTKEFTNFIPELIYAMKYHKKRYGAFMPPAWSINSLTDLAQDLIFKLFDAIETEKPAETASFISDWLGQLKWEAGQEYLRAHIKDLAMAVYNDYSKDKSLCQLEIVSKPSKSSLFRAFWT